MVLKKLTGVAVAALAALAAPASAASFIGDNVVIRRVQGGVPVFSPVSASVGAGHEYEDNFFTIDITANEVVFEAAGGNFSIGDLAYWIDGLDFDDQPSTPNLIENFASSQIIGTAVPFGPGRATVEPTGRFRMSFQQTTGGADGIARVTFGAPPVSAVPEPATWAIMVGGFGLVGGAMRSARRRKGAALRAA